MWIRTYNCTNFYHNKVYKGLPFNLICVENLATREGKSALASHIKLNKFMTFMAQETDDCLCT